MSGKNASLVSRRSLLKYGAATAAVASVVSLEGFLGKSFVLAQGSSDIDILNYALTLEHLEYAFYRDGLAKFTHFTDASGSNIAFGYFSDIRDHEMVHVNTLTSVIKSLGGTPVGEAKYNFGYTSAKGFLQIAQVLENTGVSAYDGAVALIQDRSLQTAGATIATVEARHASFLNFINGSSPFPAAFDTPKTMQQVLAAAGGFIVG